MTRAGADPAHAQRGAARHAASRRPRRPTMPAPVLTLTSWRSTGWAGVGSPAAFALGVRPTAATREPLSRPVLARLRGNAATPQPFGAASFLRDGVTAPDRWRRRPTAPKVVALNRRRLGGFADLTPSPSRGRSDQPHAPFPLPGGGRCSTLCPGLPSRCRGLLGGAWRPGAGRLPDHAGNPEMRKRTAVSPDERGAGGLPCTIHPARRLSGIRSSVGHGIRGAARPARQYAGQPAPRRGALPRRPPRRARHGSATSTTSPRRSWPTGRPTAACPCWACRAPRPSMQAQRHRRQDLPACSTSAPSPRISPRAGRHAVPSCCAGCWASSSSAAHSGTSPERAARNGGGAPVTAVTFDFHNTW